VTVYGPGDRHIRRKVKGAPTTLLCRRYPGQRGYRWPV